MRTSIRRILSGGLAGLVTGLLIAPGAAATTKASYEGNLTTDCAVEWHASAVLDADRQVNPADIASIYTGDPALLWLDLNGNPVDYANGGFVQEVTPAFGDPGRFEVQHYLTGSRTPNTVTINFRYYIGTDNPISGAEFTAQLPALPEGSSGWSVQTSSWGATRYAPAAGLPYTTPVAPVGYTLDAPATPVNPSAGVTMDLGEMPRNSAATIIFSATIPVANQNDSFVASGTVTGIDDTDPYACMPAAPAVPAGDTCTLNLAGQTMVRLSATDIELRDKWDALGPIHLTNTIGDSTDDLWRTDPAQLGEINADAWGDPNARTFRLYAGVTDNVHDVTMTFTAAQGMTFDPTTIGTILTASERGMGQLYANGFTAAATEIGTPKVSEDGTVLTVTVGSMPANSAIAFTVVGRADGSGLPMVLNETLTSTMDVCPVVPVEPEPQPTPQPQPEPSPTQPAPAPNPTTAPIAPAPTASTTPAPAASPAPSQASDELAVTGFDGNLGLFAAGLAGAGGLFLLGARRRREN